VGGCARTDYVAGKVATSYVAYGGFSARCRGSGERSGGVSEGALVF